MSDYISRQAAIDSIQYAGKIGKQTCIGILKRMPSADVVSREAVIDLIHKTILTFFDIADDDDEDTPISEKDKLLLTVNKTICNAIKDMPAEDIIVPIRCKDCKHFELDKPYVIQGIPLLGHEVCNAWGDGCKTDQNGFCFIGERRTDGVDR